MKTVCPIQEGWKLGGFDSDGFVLQAEIDSPDVEWFDILPCEDVHTALIRLGKIGDPAIGTNDEACRWVEKKIWVYRTTFDAPKGVPWLNFEGLDTFAEIYLNGKLAAHFENMLVPHVLNVSEWIREKNNDLIVCFYPVHERCTARALPEGFLD